MTTPAQKPLVEPSGKTIKLYGSHNMSHPEEHNAVYIQLRKPAAKLTEDPAGVRFCCFLTQECVYFLYVTLSYRWLGYAVVV